MKQIKFLKVLSICIFLLIAKNGAHIAIPNIFMLIISCGSIFQHFEESILPFLSSIGIIILVLKPPIKNRNAIIVTGYLLTYLMVFDSLFDEKIYKYFNRNLFFWITTVIYLLLSFYVIFKVLKFKSLDK